VHDISVLNNLIAEDCVMEAAMPAPNGIIAATNRNLEEEVASGRFRMDMFYRLNVFPISVSDVKRAKRRYCFAG